ncbi:MAG: DUF4468 domain-containing protein [Mangrovibacterium sp.]
MKKLALLLFLFFPFYANSQSYSEVIEVPGKTADQLYASARMWFADNFKSANDVLQMDDSKAGILIGKGNTTVAENYSVSMGVPMTSEWNTHFTIKVMVKDGRYKCDMYDFFVTTISNGEVLRKDDPLSYYMDQKEFFKNGSDPEWLKKNGTKMSAKTASKVFSTNYNLILKMEAAIPKVYESLKSKMVATENDNW